MVDMERNRVWQRELEERELRQTERLGRQRRELAMRVFLAQQNDPVSSLAH